MKKIHLFLIAAFSALVAIVSSCSYNPGSTPTTSTPVSLMKFTLQLHARYDIFAVDTGDASGNNVDKIIASSRKNFAEIIVDTGLSYHNKFPVTRIVFFDTTLTPVNDTGYFYQDPNGDLYRYNFGFSILNQFSYLTQAIGSQVDVGWVLAAKLGASVGTAWTAKADSVLVQSINQYVHLTSTGVMMNDTTFIVGSDSLKCHHARNTVNASALGGAESGTVILDSYYCTDIGEVVEDLFRHVSLKGPLLTAVAQGKLKIMTVK